MHILYVIDKMQKFLKTIYFAWFSAFFGSIFFEKVIGTFFVLIFVRLCRVSTWPSCEVS